MGRFIERGPNGGLHPATNNPIERAARAVPGGHAVLLLVFTAKIGAVGAVFYGWEGFLGLIGALYAGYLIAGTEVATNE